MILLILLVATISIIISLPTVNAQTSYTYNFAGPYYYDGGMANANVSCAMLWVNGTTYRFQLNGTGVAIDTVNITSTFPAYQILWNASSTLNYTSIIDFQPLTTTQNINIYIPSPNTPAFIYTFIPTDFVGMTHAYLKCGLSTDGSTYNLLQQADLNSTSDPAFVLSQYGTYQLSFLCDQGTYTQMFTAQNVFSNTIPVLAGMFPTTNLTYPTFTVQRVNSSLIGISYVDPSTSTAWLAINVTHRSGSTTINDYYTNNTGSSQTILWNGADLDKSYTVYAVAMIGTTSRTWSLIAPVEPNSNPFMGIFDFLGQSIDTFPHVDTGWPVGMSSLQIAQLIGASIIMLFLCIGSFRSAGACCILSWIIAGIMMFLGWWGDSTTTYATVPMYVFSGFVGLVVHLGEAKQTEREL
jgi:hypothetical protein